MGRALQRRNIRPACIDLYCHRYHPRTIQGFLNDDKMREPAVLSSGVTFHSPTGDEEARRNPLLHAFLVTRSFGLVARAVIPGGTNQVCSEARCSTKAWTFWPSVRRPAEHWAIHLKLCLVGDQQHSMLVNFVYWPLRDSRCTCVSEVASHEEQSLFPSHFHATASQSEYSCGLRG
ncbi:hypothetical protein Plhal304r1_c009g0035191 [Plasmopara halstedii]